MAKNSSPESDISAEKLLLRKIFKEKRRNFFLNNPSQFLASSQKINENFYDFFRQKIFRQKLPNYPKNHKKTFGLYCANNGEVPTEEIAKFLQNHNCAISYPKITGIEASLDFLSFSEGSKFIGNNIFPKILEPKNDNIISPEILIVPLLAFDKKGFRLGMGGGFYDRTLQKLRGQDPSFLAVGLAFDWQFCERELPVDENDQFVDMVISESGKFLFSQDQR